MPQNSRSLSHGTVRVQRVLWALMLGSWSAVIALTALAPRARGQSAAPAVSVNGLAYDSLRGKPLEGAFVSLVGSARTAISDSRGHFRFEDVAPGSHTFTMLHAALDSAGLPGVTVRAVVSDGRDTVRISIPSIGALWRIACATANPPMDSGFVFGTVREAISARAVAGATVAVSWLDVAYKKDGGATWQRWGGEVRSDSFGGYFVCGVPTNVALRIIASKGAAESGLLDLAPRDLRVQRRDLLLGSQVAGGPAAHGSITGIVRSESGAIVSGARISTDGVPETRSGNDGRFLLQDVLTGTRQIEVKALGALPQSAIVDVVAKDTASVMIDLHKVTLLPEVKVTASSWRQRRVDEIDARRKLGIAYFMDSTKVERFGSIANAVAMMGDPCVVYVDGMKSDMRELRFRHTADVAVIEVGKNVAVPFEYRPQDPRCTAVLIWTKGQLP